MCFLNGKEEPEVGGGQNKVSFQIKQIHFIMTSLTKPKKGV